MCTSVASLVQGMRAPVSPVRSAAPRLHTPCTRLMVVSEPWLPLVWSCDTCQMRNASIRHICRHCGAWKKPTWEQNSGTGVQRRRRSRSENRRSDDNNSDSDWRPWHGRRWTTSRDQRPATGPQQVESQAWKQGSCASKTCSWYGWQDPPIEQPSMSECTIKESLKAHAVSRMFWNVSA